MLKVKSIFRNHPNEEKGAHDKNKGSSAKEQGPPKALEGSEHHIWSYASRNGACDCTVQWFCRDTALTLPCL